MVKGIVVACAILVAGWFTVDGAIALLKGDYVTPKSGRFAGQLGPWSRVVRGVGIEPRSTAMKSIFLIYGLIWLTIITCFLLGIHGSWTGMVIAAVLSLWYLPFGTLLGLVQIVLLIILRQQP